MESVQAIRVVPGNRCLVLKTKGYNTATINGLRRTLIQEIPCYGFITEIEPEDYKIVTGTKEDRRNTVLVDTLSSQSIPVLAHRCSRLAIHTDPVTEPLLKSTETQKVFFVICQQPDDTKDMKEYMTKPLVVEELSRTIHSRDLTPVVLSKKVSDGTDTDTDTDTDDDTDDDTEYHYNSKASAKVKEEMDRIFPFNELIVVINHNQKLNVILKPTLGQGSEDIRWQPCTPLYRFNSDPGWHEQGQGVIVNGKLRRKIEGERSFRHILTHIPPDSIAFDYSKDIPYDRFGKPYGHTLMLQYNGKMNETDAFFKAVQVMSNAADMFLAKYLDADTESSMMSREVSTLSSEDGVYNSNIELLYIPRNTQDQLPEDEYILTNATMGNLITVKMLEIVDKRIQKDELWSHIHIGYKIPHPLIKQCQILIKIPDSLGITHKDLVVQAVTEIKHDLFNLKNAVEDEVEVEVEDGAEDRAEDEE
jgi:DNA-directed RNA polymerase subunit L